MHIFPGKTGIRDELAEFGGETEPLCRRTLSYRRFGTIVRSNRECG